MRRHEKRRNNGTACYSTRHSIATDARRRSMPSDATSGTTGSTVHGAAPNVGGLGCRNAKTVEHRRSGVIPGPKRDSAPASGAARSDPRGPHRAAGAVLPPSSRRLHRRQDRSARNANARMHRHLPVLWQLHPLLRVRRVLRAQVRVGGRGMSVVSTES